MQSSKDQLIVEAVDYAMNSTICANISTERQLLEIAMRRIKGKANPREVLLEIRARL